MDPAKIQKQPSEIDLASLASLYASVGFGAAGACDLAQLEQAVSRSLIYIALDNVDNTIIGVLRAMSDGALTTWIAEVIVAPARQRTGVGKQLVETFLEDYAHTAIYAEALAGSEVFLSAVA